MQCDSYSDSLRQHAQSDKEYASLPTPAISEVTLRTLCIHQFGLILSSWLQQGSVRRPDSIATQHKSLTGLSAKAGWKTEFHNAAPYPSNATTLIPSYLLPSHLTERFTNTVITNSCRLWWIHSFQPAEMCLSWINSELFPASKYKCQPGPRWHAMMLFMQEAHIQTQMNTLWTKHFRTM